MVTGGSVDVWVHPVGASHGEPHFCESDLQEPSVKVTEEALQLPEAGRDRRRSEIRLEPPFFREKLVFGRNWGTQKRRHPAPSPR